MPNILDQFQKNAGAFRPATPKQYAALQAARKLNQVHQVRVYAALFERYTLDVVLHAVRQVLHARPADPLHALEGEIEARVRKEEQWLS